MGLLENIEKADKWLAKNPGKSVEDAQRALSSDKSSGYTNYSTPTPSPPSSSSSSGSSKKKSSSPTLPSYAIPQQSTPVPNPYNEILYSKQVWEGPDANDGTKSWASENAKQYYNTLSPDEADKIRNMNASELSAYIPKPPQRDNSSQNIDSVSSAIAANTPIPKLPEQPIQQPIEQIPKYPYGVGMPTYAIANPYAQLSPQQIQAEAKARIDKLIADKTRYADQTKKGLTTTYDRLRANFNEDRALQNAQMQDHLDPFNKRSDYERGMVELQRARTDREASNNYQTQMGNVDAQLNDFLQATPEQQQQMINELTRIERDYGLQDKQLTMQLENQLFNQTMANRQLDRSIYESDRNFGYQQGRDTRNDLFQDRQVSLQEQNQQFNQTQALRQSRIDLAAQLSQQFGTYVYPTEDPMLTYAQVAGLSTVVAQKIAQDAQQQGFDNAIKAALAQNTINETQANLLNQARQISIQQQNADTASRNAATRAESNNSAIPDDDILKYLK